MTDIPLSLGLLTLMASVIGIAFAIWWRIEARVKESEKTASGKAEVASAQALLTSKELADYKTHVAETYITKVGHRESTDQIMSAISGVRDAVNGTNERIDRMFETPARRGRGQS